MVQTVLHHAQRRRLQFPVLQLHQLGLPGTGRTPASPTIETAGRIGATRASIEALALPLANRWWPTSSTRIASSSTCMGCRRRSCSSSSVALRLPEVAQGGTLDCMPGKVAVPCEWNSCPMYIVELSRGRALVLLPSSYSYALHCTLPLHTTVAHYPPAVAWRAKARRSLLHHHHHHHHLHHLHHCRPRAVESPSEPHRSASAQASAGHNPVP